MLFDAVGAFRSHFKDFRAVNAHTVINGEKEALRRVVEIGRGDKHTP